MKTFVIAEAGANHDRNFNQAITLIDVAKRSGASAVKFQTYSSETLYCKNTSDFAGYKNINQLIKDIELPREWQKDLKQYCDEVGIEFMSTPFDEQAVQELVDIGVKRLKIAGFESTDMRFVEMVASSKLPLIISLGIGFTSELMNKILKIRDKYDNDISLLHCNNAYPTPMSDVGLVTMSLLRDWCYMKGVSKIGLSDHTTSTLTPSLAVAKGADIIEKHFTISKCLSGPDHKFALEPDELTEMVDLIKQTEETLVTHNSLYTESEKPFIHARRSVVSKRKIHEGEQLSEENITTKRPFLNGVISASEYQDVIGLRVLRDIEEDMPIKENYVSR
jgi:sialic acid synthase SpsE